jgi:hypothetical protein
MNHQKNLMAIALIASFTMAGTAQAALSTNGNGLIYDNVSNITFTSDANLFKTQLTSVASLVNTIISDTATVGAHAVAATDFDINSGTMNWWGAQAWIGYLNKTTYHGYNTWSLPITNPATVSPDKTGSQLSELFYDELGGITGSSIVTTHNDKYNLFTNFPNAAAFWSSTDNAAQPASSAWYFDNTNGGQGYSNKNGYANKVGYFSALPILQGNASPVPVPGAAWLFGTGLIGLWGFKKHKNIG